MVCYQLSVIMFSDQDCEYYLSLKIMSTYKVFVAMVSQCHRR